MIQKLFEPAPCACQPEACSRQHGGSLPAGSHPSVPQVPESHVALVSIAFSAPEASTSSQAHVHHHHTACTATVAHMGWTHPGSKAHDDEGAITILEHEVHANTALAVALESKPVVAAEMSQKATRPSVARELLPRARAQQASYCWRCHCACCTYLKPGPA